jgi:hypothetical protein
MFVDTTALTAKYAPYHHMSTFWLGYDDYMAGKALRTYRGVAGQAYDRGAQYGAEMLKIIQWEEANIGLD